MTNEELVEQADAMAREGGMSLVSVIAFGNLYGMSQAAQKGLMGERAERVIPKLVAMVDEAYDKRKQLLETEAEDLTYSASAMFSTAVEAMRQHDVPKQAEVTTLYFAMAILLGTLMARQGVAA